MYKINPYQVLNIIDSSTDCDDALELIYEDENYEYYFPCIKSEWVEVTYADGTKENVVDALREKHIGINDLTTFDIDFIKQEKN